MGHIKPEHRKSSWTENIIISDPAYAVLLQINSSHHLRVQKGGLAERWHDEGKGGGVWIPPKIDDVIYEQPLKYLLPPPTSFYDFWILFSPTNTSPHIKYLPPPPTAAPSSAPSPPSPSCAPPCSLASGQDYFVIRIFFSILCLFSWQCCFIPLILPVQCTPHWPISRSSISSLTASGSPFDCSKTPSPWMHFDVKKRMIW